MTLLYIKRYDRQLIQAHPDWLFVFGDNLERKGYAGQAKEARGEPNAVGIATKRSPSNAPQAFLYDGEFPQWEASEAPAMQRIWEVHKNDGVIVWPLDGIGTGLAQLDETAPAIFREIEEFRLALEKR